MALTPKQKLVYELHRKRGIPQTEIAKRLRINPSGVCRLLSRAEERLNRIVELCPPECQSVRELVENAM